METLKDVFIAIVFTFVVLCLLIICAVGVVTFIDKRNVISMDESVQIIQQLAQTDDIEVISHSEISFWGSWHEVTMTLLIDGEPYIARCKNHLTGPTLCMYYEPNDAELVDIWN